MMKRFTRLLQYLLVLGLASTSVLAQADLSGAPPAHPVALPLTKPVPATYENVLKAAIRFGAFDLNDDRFIDNFAEIFHCDIYQKYHANEFDWRRVRTAMRKSIQSEIPTYPTVVYLERDEFFTTYDFTAGILNLATSSVMRQTSNLELARIDEQNECASPADILPHLFTGLLDNPIQIDGIELTEEQARDVVAGLKIVPMRNVPVFAGQSPEILRSAYGRYLVQLTSLGRSSSKDTMVFTAHLINITFYEDPAFSIPFWRGDSTIKAVMDRTNSTLQSIPFKGIDEVGAK